MISTEPLTENDVITFGKYKDKKIANVPAEYFIYLLTEGICFGALRTYIRENLEHLRMEAAYNSKYLAK